MAAVSASITKIRRLVNDVNTQLWSDANILSIYGREQQNFCRETESLVKVVMLAAPPHVDWCICFGWEEGYTDSISVFDPFFRDATYSCSQPWELEVDNQLSEGGDTITGGTELAYTEAQHGVPFILPTDFYKFEGLVFDKGWVNEQTEDWMQTYYGDAFTNTGDIVDWFAMVGAERGKAFLTHGVPYTVQASGSNEDSAIDTALIANVFYAIYASTPGRPSAASSTIETYEPFQKYVEFRVATRLLRADTRKKNDQKAKHFETRAEIGKLLVGRIMWNLTTGARRGFGPRGRRPSLRPARPRLPDHYPALEA